MKNLVKISVEENSERIYENILQNFRESSLELTGLEGYLSATPTDNGGANISLSTTRPVEQVEEESTSESRPIETQGSFSEEDFIAFGRSDIKDLLREKNVWNDADQNLIVSPQAENNGVYATRIFSENSTNELFLVNMISNYTIGNLVHIIDIKEPVIDHDIRRRGN